MPHPVCVRAWLNISDKVTFSGAKAVFCKGFYAQSRRFWLLNRVAEQLGCGMAQLVASVRRPRVRISVRYPSGDPLPELAAMKKLERNSANVMNECV
jgi:hypothetical protein